MKNNNPILLLEDDQIDVICTRRALTALKITNPLEVCENGEVGLSYLKNLDNSRPCLVLLDINMPKMNGLEFLEIIKNDTSLRSLPVIMFTSSRGEQDRFESFDLGVAGYIVKPTDPKAFVDVLRTVDIYWTLSELP